MTFRLILLPYLRRFTAYCLLVQAVLLVILRPRYRDVTHVGVKAEMGVTIVCLFLLDAKSVHASAQAPMTRSF